MCASLSPSWWLLGFGACCPQRSNPSCRPLRWQSGADQMGSVSLALPARTGRVPSSKTVIDKLLDQRAAVSMFCPQVLTAPAAHLRRPWQRPAAHRFLVHCAAASVSASSPLFKVSPSFKTGSHTVAGTMRIALAPRRSSQLWGCRLTNRCSGRGHIKCSAAGGRAMSAPERWRARVLKRQRAAAELGR